MRIKEKTEYDIQAEEFMGFTGLEIHKSYCGHYKRSEDAKYIVSQWRIKFSRGKQEFWFDFSQSVHDSFSKTELGKLRRKSLDMQDYNYTAVRMLLETGVMGVGMFLPFILHYEKTPPSDYDILACLTKYDPGTFDDFCSNFGYDTDSRKAEKTYFAVQKEYQNLQNMFSEAELEKMAEIQ